MRLVSVSRAEADVTRLTRSAERTANPTATEPVREIDHWRPIPQANSVALTREFAPAQNTVFRAGPLMFRPRDTSPGVAGVEARGCARHPEPTRTFTASARSEAVVDTRDVEGPVYPPVALSAAAWKPQAFPRVQLASMQAEAKPVAPDSLPPVATPPEKSVAKAPTIEIAVRSPVSRAAAKSVSAPTIRSSADAEEPAKPSARPPVVSAGPAETPASQPLTAKADCAQVGPFQVIDQAEEFTVAIRRSKLLRIRTGIGRAVVVDPGICDVVQFTPQEVLIVGKSQGATHVTFWFDDSRQEPATYLVRVTPDPEVQRLREQQCAAIERHLAGVFPNRNIRLVPSRDMMFLKGDVCDAHEAARILETVRRLAFAPGAEVGLRGVLVNEIPSDRTDREQNVSLPPAQVVNLLNIPIAR